MKQALIYALLYVSALFSMQSNESFDSTETAPTFYTRKQQSENHLYTPQTQNTPSTARPTQRKEKQSQAPQQSTQATLLLGAWVGLLQGPEFGYYD